ncbi:MAG: hypothetical protein ABIU05_11060 [Nitrospirales bacterium]
MHDGKDNLMQFISTLHPHAEIYLDDLEPERQHALPPGFSITDNPQALSIWNPDPWRTVLFGPLGDQGVPLPVRQGSRGVYVSGLNLAASLMVLVRQGPPTWERNSSAMMNYIRTEIEKCELFQVAEPAPKTRPQMDDHIEKCATCGPVASSMAAAISAGSTAYRDADVADMIERSHTDSAGAIKHYDAKRAACSIGTAASTPKPSRRRAVSEVSA